jgi:CII-binding regulator of phage lambda lysogenization HflD
MALFNRTPKASQSDLETLKTELVALREELTKRTNALSLVTALTNGLDQKISIIDQRVTTMTTELSNQIHELGSEIETMTKSSQDSVSHEALEQLRVSQIRIANEQARYEIAFRQDLAELVEQIRRTQ